MHRELCCILTLCVLIIVHGAESSESKVEQLNCFLARLRGEHGKESADCKDIWTTKKCSNKLANKLCDRKNVKKNCQKTCCLCGTESAECIDNWENKKCSNKRAKNLCDRKSVKKNCQKTCGFCSSGSGLRVGRINHGRQASLGQLPSIAFLKISKYDAATRRHKASSQCAGTLIAKEWVLTAAHCVSGIDLRIDQITAHPGIVNSKYDGFSRDVEQVVKHEKFDAFKNDLTNDIAVLKLKVPVPETHYVKIAKMSDAKKDGKFEGKQCVTAGWGHTEKGPTQQLMEVEMTQISNGECFKLWDSSHRRDRHPITNNNICLYDSHGRGHNKASTGKGDSGGPMMCGDKNKQYLAGVVSWGSSGDLPSVFTRVSAYKKWVCEKTGVGKNFLGKC